jgi:hypothetical protein
MRVGLEEEARRRKQEAEAAYLLTLTTSSSPADKDCYQDRSLKKEASLSSINTE